MSINSELAQAAHRINALLARMPEDHRPDISAEWRRLSKEIRRLSDPEARAVVVEWLSQTEHRLTGARAATPVSH
jgi:hypothetical protein